MSYNENNLIIDKILSAWTGHKDFAQWLVRETRPGTVVELGVDYGFSFFTFANELSQTRSGKIYGIDWFNGDDQTGSRDTKQIVMHLMQLFNLWEYGVFIPCTFMNAASVWTLPIDVLHIDGHHSYESVKEDFTTWKDKVRDDGVILFHDVCVGRSDFGVARLFNEIEGYHKGYFPQSYGLGVISKNSQLMQKIAAYPNFIVSYTIDPVHNQ